MRWLAGLGALLLMLLAAGILWRAGLPSPAEGEAPGESVARLDAPMPPLRGVSINAGYIDLAPPTQAPLVINFWATWCVPCQREMPLLQALYAEGVPVVAVNAGLEDAATITAWLENYDLRFPTLVDDEQRSLERRFGLRGLPTTYFIDAQGVLRYVHRGELRPADLAAGLAAIQISG